MSDIVERLEWWLELEGPDGLPTVEISDDNGGSHSLREDIAEAIDEFGWLREQWAGRATEIERLTAALRRIDAINDNPARFSSEINSVIFDVFHPHKRD